MESIAEEYFVITIVFHLFSTWSEISLKTIHF